jgi:hypothetical protein
MGKVRNRRLRRVAILALAALTLVVTATAIGARTIEKVELRAGDLLIVGRGGFKPETLPQFKDAPIKVYGGGKLSTVSGEVPPILDRIIFEFDRHGHVDNKGLEVCTAGKLQATDVPAARKACPNAIIGKGFGTATVVFPEQAPIPASSPITLFNGPKKGRNDTFIAHAFTTIPVSTTFIVPITIEKINKGVYGYRVDVKIPKIAGGYGHPVSGRVTVDRKWTFKGKKYSYVNARCETGRLQARGEFSFKDGTLLKGTFIRPCKVLRE